MTIEEFLRAFPLRGQNIGWFLGAGASAAAGVPTATALLWDFKRSLYCTESRIPVRLCADLGDPNVRLKLQQFFDSKGSFPQLESADEYACYFEHAFPDEADRRRFLEKHVAAATPSYGHLALGALMRMGHIRMVWTTNFDKAVEDGAAQLLGTTGKLVVATLDSSKLALEAMNESRWPLLVKLHGDFQSRRLKNTSEELRTQDIELRSAFVEACKRSGMAIAGYSGRDESILKALEDGISGGRGFPGGLFWFHKRGSSVLPKVAELIQKAKAAGIAAHLIEVETFDELMADILAQVPDIPDAIQVLIGSHRPKVSDAPTPGTPGIWPVIRLNALPLKSHPSVCRKFTADIGGTREVREVLLSSGATAVAARTSAGVIAFGSDPELKKAFDSRKLRDLDIHRIQAHRLRYDSAEFGLLYETLARSLVRNRDLTAVRRNRDYYVQPASPTSAAAKLLQPLVGSVSGIIGKTTLKWSEAIKLRLDYRYDRLWLLLEPTVLADRPTSTVDRNIRMEFIRERLARRYNPAWNDLLEAWINIFLGSPDATETTFQAFGISDGTDATFTISRTTGFSWRAK